MVYYQNLSENQINEILNKEIKFQLNNKIYETGFILEDFTTSKEDKILLVETVINNKPLSPVLLNPSYEDDTCNIFLNFIEELWEENSFKVNTDDIADITYTIDDTTHIVSKPEIKLESKRFY